MDFHALLEMMIKLNFVFLATSLWVTFGFCQSLIETAFLGQAGLVLYVLMTFPLQLQIKDFKKCDFIY